MMILPQNYDLRRPHLAIFESSWLSLGYFCLAEAFSALEAVALKATVSQGHRFIMQWGSTYLFLSAMNTYGVDGVT